jgi:hypothetical protein
MSFTMFDKFEEVFEKLPKEQSKELAYAVTMYGYTGEVPSLPYPLDLMFSLMCEDIDNSKASRSGGSKGGRPRKGHQETEKPQVPETEKPQVLETQKPQVLEVGKPQVPETEKPQVLEIKNLGLPKNGNPNQTKPNQTKPVQGGGTRAGARMPPPTVEEVAEYAKGYAASKRIDLEACNFSAERFHDHFASNGWKVGGRAPMKDWKAALRNWVREDMERSGVAEDDGSAAKYGF